MKRVILVAALSILLLMLTGCKDTSISLTAGFITDWESPDGVHYWVSPNQGFIAPRYDKNGQLVTD